MNGGAGEEIVFIAPGNKNDMMGFAEKARKAGAPFIFDPGQSLNIWEGPELRQAISGAACFVSNDYELHLFLQMTKWKVADLYDHVDVVITTNGPEGVVLDTKGDRVLIPAVPVKAVLDPTGAGDAFRGGLLKALKMGLPWDTSCQFGVTAASFAIEQYGTQEHNFGRDEFCQRYEPVFGPIVCW